MKWAPCQVVAVPAQPPHREHPDGKMADGVLREYHWSLDIPFELLQD